MQTPASAPSDSFNAPGEETRGEYNGGVNIVSLASSAARAADLAAKACSLVKGEWCKQYYSLPWQPFKPVPRGDKPCPKDCNGVGNCNHDSGLCECPAGGWFAGEECRCTPTMVRPCCRAPASAGPAPSFVPDWCLAAGWTGDDCTQPLKRPCTNRLSDPDDMPPLSHIDGNGRDLNVTAPGWTPGRCGGGWAGRPCCSAAGRLGNCAGCAGCATRPSAQVTRLGTATCRLLRRRVRDLLVRLPLQVRAQEPQGLVQLAQPGQAAGGWAAAAG